MHAWQIIGIAIGTAMISGIVLTLLLATMAALLFRQVQRRRTVIAEYEAPKQLSAAELGYLIDATFGSNELLATLAQLQIKGALTLVPRGSSDFMVHLAADAKPPVDDGEASVLGYLQSLPTNQISWTSLRSALSATVGPQADFESSVLQSLAAKGFLRSTYFGELLFGDVVARVSALILAIVCIVPLYHFDAAASSSFAGLDEGIVHMVLWLAVLPLWFLWELYLSLARYLYRMHDGVPTRATPLLHALWPDVAGYRLFLKETAFVRLQHDTNAFDPAMPYCVALGLDPGFIKSLTAL